MRAWDVVKEAVDMETDSGFTESVFYSVLGPDYVADAFRWARDARCAPGRTSPAPRPVVFFEHAVLRLPALEPV